MSATPDDTPTPVPDADGSATSLPGLDDFYVPLTGDEPLVIAQLGQSLDGFIASRTGDAEFVTGPEDRRHLHVLRSLVDAVVVGAATVIADDCRLTVRDAPLRTGHPTRVVLDPRGRVPRSSHLLTEPDAPTLWLVGEAADVPDDLPEHVEVVVREPGAGYEPAEVLDALAERGLRRVLVEGGGRLVSSFLAAGALDRLFVTCAPVLIGDGVPGLRFSGTDVLADAIRPPSRRLVLGDDVCTELLLRG
ncbi:RibD family protein [Mobilicoccus massiliensis]|uniref:RibD family protein n=1 Tax=Mobilicoccus massiliensis TaxID=1522310 RepID=UPI00058FEE25|nr:RibD family protein [Mobilicoccus massiliensis]